MDRQPRDDLPIPAVVTNDEPRTIAHMNPDMPMRFVLAAALIADTIASYLLYSNAFATPNGRQAVLGATALALLVAGVAVTVVRKPSELALSLARGIAVVMTVGLAGVGLLFFLATNFESGISDKDQAEMLGLMLVAVAVQVTIFVAARSVDGRGLVESMGSAINGAFKFWAVGIVLVLILSLFEGLIP
jgi:hypothetical protein